MCHYNCHLNCLVCCGEKREKDSIQFYPLYHICIVNEWGSGKNMCTKCCCICVLFFLHILVNRCTWCYWVSWYCRERERKKEKKKKKRLLNQKLAPMTKVSLAPFVLEMMQMLLNQLVAVDDRFTADRCKGIQESTHILSSCFLSVSTVHCRQVSLSWFSSGQLS